MRPIRTWPLRGSICLFAAAAGLAAATSAAPGQNLSAAPASARLLSEAEAGGGIREALAQGVGRAIERLGRTDGFLADQAVRILIPGKIRKITDGARKLGAGKLVDAFEVSMNRAAEQAVSVSADVFSDAVRQMTWQDALAIVRGGEDAGTKYFRKATEGRLREQFLPIVRSATDASGATRNFKKLSKRSALLPGLGGDPEQPFDLDEYVTQRALDGLFHYVAEEEKSIRKDPLGQASNLLRRVFSR